MTGPSQNQTEEPMSMDCNFPVESNHPKADLDMDSVKDIVMQTMKKRDVNSDLDSNGENISKGGVVVPSSSKELTSDNESKNLNRSRKSSVSGPDASKPLRKKAKLLRMERKAQKLTLANKLPEDFPKKQPKNVQKSLDTLLNEVQGNSRHKLEVCIQVCHNDKVNV